MNVSFLKLLKSVATRAGLDPVVMLAGTTSTPSAITQYLNDAVRLAWTWFDWPDIILLEERTPVSGVISFTQADEEEIFQVIGVFTTENEIISIPYELQPGQIELDSTYDGATAWVRFWPMFPQFSYETYNASTTYAVNDIVFYTPNCYKAIASTVGNLPTSTAHWQIQNVPRFLENFISIQAYADLLSEDGQEDKAIAARLRAEGTLISEMDNYWLRAGQSRTWGVSRR